LRERASERERLYIASHYDDFVTGNLENSRKTYELWARTYPRDDVPANNLGVIYFQLGQYEKSLAAVQRLLEIDPGSGLSYATVATVQMYMNRLDEAKATGQAAFARGLDADYLHVTLYLVGFLQHDAAAMRREAGVMTGKPGVEDLRLYMEADTAAFAGQLGKARELSRRAAEAAERSDQKETAAHYLAEAAAREAMVGNLDKARQQAQASLRLTNGKDAAAWATIALALAGDAAQSGRLTADLAKRFPEDTLVQFYYLPTVRGAAALRAANAEGAINALEAAAPYELGVPNENFNFALYPVYVRAQAYLAARQGGAAAAEFQKILSHPGVGLNQVIVPLAHLGLGRAYLLSGEKDKARSGYQEFLDLWKDADPDVPILRQAKAEYAASFSQ
jgi:tetratricopeptide (TPR) repeat protein